MKTNGFTLIELMIVMAIIGIVAAVVIPAFQHRSKVNACQGDISCLQNVDIEQQKSAHSGTSSRATESCVHGFVVLPNGSQMLDSQGHGVSCGG